MFRYQLASDTDGVMIKINDGEEDVDFIPIHPTTSYLRQFKLAWRQHLRMVGLANHHLFDQLLTKER